MYRKTLFAVLVVLILSALAIPAMAQEPTQVPNSGDGRTYLPVVLNDAPGEPEVYYRLAKEIRVWHSYSSYVCFDLDEFLCASNTWETGTYIMYKPHYVFFNVWIQWGWDVRQSDHTHDHWYYTPSDIVIG